MPAIHFSYLRLVPRLEYVEFYAHPLIHHGVVRRQLEVSSFIFYNGRKNDSQLLTKLIISTGIRLFLESLLVQLIGIRAKIICKLLSISTQLSSNKYCVQKVNVRKKKLRVN
jgi:hypothetical protein